MSSRRFHTVLIAAAAAVFCLRAAGPSAPDSVVGKHYRYVETNGASIITFLPNNEFTVKRTNALAERGYFTPRRAENIWEVAATKWDGSITWLYAFTFQNATSGVVTITVPTRGTRVASFQESNGTELPPPDPVATNNAPATLTSMFVTNSFSAAGPSHYRIDFRGGSHGTFVIRRPGYGTGSFAYTPGVNTGRLVMTYAADLTGDRDDLALRFSGGSGAPGPSSYSGTQSIGGREEPIAGVFSYLGAMP